MMLGKRPRPPMTRTTSMSEITFDLSTDSEEAQPSAENPHLTSQYPVGFSGNCPDQWLSAAAMAVASPRGHRRASVDFSETAHFLRSCSLCKRRLVPGRDIYMYRGDSAFCSLECRQQQMNQDERKERCSMASKKEATSSTAVPEVPAKGETVVAL